MFRSVRGRITLIATGVVAIAFALASMLILQMVESDLVATTERALEAELELTADAFDSDTSSNLIEIVDTDEGFGFGLFYEEEFFAFGTVFDDDGMPLVDVSLDTDQMIVMELFDPFTGEVINDPELSFELGELAFEAFDVDGDSGNALLVGAVARSEVDETLGAVRDALLVIVPVLAALLGMLIWVLVGRALQPVRAISDEVQSISTTNLDRRVPVPAGNDEVSGLANVMNHMLSRLQRGDQRQRQFAADASHELRSPLATMRAAAEIIERNPSSERAPTLANDIVAEADRMDALIGDLLNLARVDEDVAAQSHRPVDLTVLVQQMASQQTATDMTVEVTTPSEAILVLGSEPQLDRAIRNLTGNALRHTATQVTIGLSIVASHTGQRYAVLCVEDDGDGVPVDQREIIFERFSRLDQARSRDRGGVGLGLALVKAIATRHRGTISVDESPSLGGARFALHLPISG